MKSIKFFVITVCIAFVLASCSTTYVFTNKSLFEGYLKTLSSKDKNELRDKIYILLSQKELVHADYEVISWNAFVADNNKMLEDLFFAKAAEKANEQGGNAVLINSPGCYSVLKVTNWNGHEPEQLFENPIYYTDELDALLTYTGKMNSNEYADLKFKCVNAIELSISCAYNLEEVAFIRKKIESLTEFNANNPKANLTVSIKYLNRELEKKEEKIRNQNK